MANGKDKRIYLDRDDVTLFLQFVTPIFIFIGFIYNYLYFDYFGIKIVNYSTLSDYIAASFGKVLYILFAGAAGVGGYLFGWFLGLSVSKEEKYIVLRGIVVTAILVIIALILHHYSHVEEGSLKVGLVMFLGLLVAFWIIPHFTQKYLERPERVSFFLSFLFLSVAFAILGAYEDATLKEIHYGEEQVSYLLRGHSAVPSEYNYIGSNSGYFFFVNKDRKQLIIPSGEILQISTQEDKK